MSASTVTQVDCFLNLPTRDQTTKSVSVTPVNGYSDNEQDDHPKENGTLKKVYII